MKKKSCDECSKHVCLNDFYWQSLCPFPSAEIQTELNKFSNATGMYMYPAKSKKCYANIICMLEIANMKTKSYGL